MVNVLSSLPDYPKERKSQKRAWTASHAVKNTFYTHLQVQLYLEKSLSICKQQQEKVDLDPKWDLLS